ncbi:MAG: MmcQ/YjbR family DNA-binding protein [Mucilaginibacter polytrichastri]|nr:MmcQ/YjbR family DNA-binding protein [Mucilaginibacter polytrichastri]
MNVETLREYALSFSHVTEEFPFGPETLVFKVAGKMFLLTSLDDSTTFNAKCDPERAVQLREEYEEVQPGYHMNKKHWNTVALTGRLTENQLKELIAHSYDLVKESLPKKIRDEINATK